VSGLVFVESGLGYGKGFRGFYDGNKLGLLGVHGRPTRRVHWWFSWVAIIGLIFIS